MKVIRKDWGEEDMLVMNDAFMMKRLIICAGESTSKHYHTVKRETFYVVDGEGVIDIDGKLIVLRPHIVVHIDSGMIHQTMAKTCLVIIETSTPEFEDVVRLS